MKDKQIFQEAARMVAEGEVRFSTTALDAASEHNFYLRYRFLTLMHTPNFPHDARNIRHLRVMLLLMAGEVLGDDA